MANYTGEIHFIGCHKARWAHVLLLWLVVSGGVLHIAGD